MNFRECFQSRRDILMEGALGERLKREYGLSFDEHVAMAKLIYQPEGAAALTELWSGYIDIARRYDLPFMATTPTRRANRERLAAANATGQVIADNVAFLKEIRRSCGIEMYVGGLVGCRGDAYTGEGALSEEDALEFHRWTAEQFRTAGAEFLYAGIMPTLPEAAGLARAISDTEMDYIISFTIQQDGTLIDGTTISDAVSYIDSVTVNNPLCYMTNCVHPSIAAKALGKNFNCTDRIRERFSGIQANTSPLTYAELDGAKELYCSDPEKFSEEMMDFGLSSNIRIWGGCCGTDHRHMECIAQKIKLHSRNKAKAVL